MFVGHSYFVDTSGYTSDLYASYSKATNIVLDMSIILV